jgi:hypothetical protein
MTHTEDLGEGPFAQWTLHFVGVPDSLVGLEQ